MIGDLYSCFTVTQRPHLKKRYRLRVERVKEYLETVKDFDELISPQSLILHILGLEQSTKVRKDLEVVKKSKCFFSFCHFLISFFFYLFFVLSGMMTRFSKLKLVEIQEKKAKGGTVSGLLSKKKAGDVVKKDPTKMPPPAKRPASPTSSLEMIASSGNEVRTKKKSDGKSFLPTFWDDADAAALKAHKVLFVDDLSPLMAKSSSEMMWSNIQKLMQVSVLGRLYFFFFFTLFLLRMALCRLWGSLCLSLGSSWTWKRRWLRLSL